MFALDLEIRNVSKRYDNGVFGVRNLNCQIDPGVLGILGPNGAGKSTLLQILATIMQPTQGSVVWQGKDVHKNPQSIREVLGYLPQKFGLPDYLNALEYLHYMGLLKGMKPNSISRARDYLLVDLNLEHVKKHKLATYSIGMKQRVGIAQALLNSPEILLLDEPTVGLDPQERISFRNIIKEHATETIVIVSSHIVSDIESMADRVAIIFDGRLLTLKSVQELLGMVKGQVWEAMIPLDELAEFRSENTTTNISRTVQGAQVRFLSNQVRKRDSRLVAPTLEDAYMHVINLYNRGAES